MNDRITELAKQCDMSLFFIGDGLSINAISGKNIQKFAELIVRECIDIIEPTSHHKAFAQGYLGDVDGLELLGKKVKKIKEHFGVEE